MKYRVVACLSAACAIAIVGVPVAAQNVDEMVKWTSAAVIHYDVVAEYTGATPILKAPPKSPVTGYSTQVKDRFEASFDWSPTEMALVGQATFRNFPATLPNGTPGGTMLGQPCPSPKVNGAYDFVEVVSAKTGLPGSNSLALTITRTFPAGVIAYATETGCNNWLEVAKTTETVTDGLVVPLGMFLVMPSAVPPNMTIGKDGKTMTLVDKGRGWTYTYTLRIVK